MQVYKTDEAIAGEFQNFTIESIEHDFTGSTGARSGYITILWPNAGDHVGGGLEEGDESTDRWIDYNGDGKKIAFDSWYPDDVYTQLCTAINKHFTI